MPAILFVHGTGVRLASYTRTLSLIKEKARQSLKDAAVHQCLWGEPCGARLNLGGASIPTYDDTAAATPSSREAGELEEAAWLMLAEDPLFEIRLLQGLAVPRREMGPNSRPAGEAAFEMLRNLVLPAGLAELLDNKELRPYWEEAYREIVLKPDTERILKAAARDPRETSRAIARALTASLIRIAMEAGHPGASEETRIQIVDLLIPSLGQRALAPFDWVTKPLIGVAKRLATYKGRRDRRALTDGTAPVAGDIIYYQARGKAIRDFIRERINEIDDEVIIISHSLGGIATVDLLIEEDLSDRVKGLVTLGSQAPFLYEINALVSLPCGNPLPDHFPSKWLNIWDPNDFLSYIGEIAFGRNRIEDFMVLSKIAFPDSHSAYWDKKEVWTKIQTSFHW